MRFGIPDVQQTHATVRTTKGQANFPNIHADATCQNCLITFETNDTKDYI